MRHQVMLVSLAKLADQGKDARLVLRLAMAANDLAIANVCMSECQTDSRVFSPIVRKGAEMYFVRLQSGHLAEALKLIVDIENSRTLRRLADRLPEDVLAAYTRLLSAATSQSQQDKFRSRVTSIRDKLTFHYDDDVVKRALRMCSTGSRSKNSKITRGTHITRWRFDVADVITDTAVCRVLWNIPFDTDLRAAASKLAGYGSDLGRDLLTFVGELVWRYLAEHAGL